jgi:hypothetical protein
MGREFYTRTRLPRRGNSIRTNPFGRQRTPPRHLLKESPPHRPRQHRRPGRPLQRADDFVSLHTCLSDLRWFGARLEAVRDLVERHPRGAAVVRERD